MPKAQTSVEKKEDALTVSEATKAVTESAQSLLDYVKNFQLPDSLKDLAKDVGIAAADAALTKVVDDLSDTTKFTDVNTVVKQIAVAVAKQGRNWLHGGVVAGGTPDTGPRDASGNVKH